MLSPDWPVTRWILGVVLLALLAVLVLRAVRRDRRDYQRFKGFTETADRQRMYRRWLLEAFAVFGVASAVILLLAWRFVGALLGEVRLWPVARWFSGLLSSTGALIPGLALALAAVLIVGTVVAVLLARRSLLADGEDVPTIGDIGALLPRNRRELLYGAGLSLNAGIFEELLFRLGVPALVFAITGSAIVAVVGGVLLFAALHSYQGVPGIAGALIIGTLLMLLYLTTGSIVVPIVAHALLDLRSLVLIPLVVYGVHRRPGVPSEA